MDRKTFVAFVLAIAMFLLGVHLMGEQMKAFGAERATIRIFNTSKYTVIYRLYWVDHPHGIWVNPLTGQIKEEFEFAVGELKPGAKHDIDWPTNVTLRAKVYCPKYVNHDQNCEENVPKFERVFFLSSKANRAIVSPDGIVVEYK